MDANGTGTEDEGTNSPESVDTSAQCNSLSDSSSSSDSSDSSSHSSASSSNSSEEDGVDSSTSDGTVTVEGAGIGPEVVPEVEIITEARRMMPISLTHIQVIVVRELFCLDEDYVCAEPPIIARAHKMIINTWPETKAEFSKYMFVTLCLYYID
jgi:hypothetical protein